MGSILDRKIGGSAGWRQGRFAPRLLVPELLACLAAALAAFTSNLRGLVFE